MNIQITGRHFHASAALQENVRASIERLGRFNDSITNVHVILDIQSNGIRRAEMVAHISEKDVCAVAEDGFMYKAIESMIKKMERQLKKEKQKLKVHKSVPVADLIAEP